MQTQKNHFGIILAMGLCVLWMAVTFVIGAMGLYEYQRKTPHLYIYITVLLPTIFYTILFIFLPSVRIWTQQLSLAMLALPHAWRTIGFVFIALWAYGILPMSFGLQAGMGDFLTGLAAPFIAVALWLKWSGAIKATVLFNLFGLIDLSLAILIGTKGYGVAAEAMTNIDPMTTFPMVIIPTLFVPLLITAHIISLTKIVMDKKAPLQL